MQDQQPFSRRHGYRSTARNITVREDAPEGFRYALLDAAERELKLSPKTLRHIVCGVLHTRPNLSNWSEYPNIWEEVQALVYECHWYRVYDIAEEFYRHLNQFNGQAAQRFADILNDSMTELGIGWQMKDGLIQSRSNDAFENTVAGATAKLHQAGLPTAASELKEAVLDLSRRPDPDLSGAVHHAMSALECVARQVSRDTKDTLGSIISKHPELFPKPLDAALSKMWGFASETARHGSESRTLAREEAELVVAVCAAMASYVAAKAPGGTYDNGDSIPF